MYKHDSSIWWKLIERITRPPQSQHTTLQQLHQKVNKMTLHQQKLLQPHTELDAQFDNEWFRQVNDFMTNEYPA
jgi:hypothetical protein